MAFDVVLPVLLIYMIWGISCIKEVCNSCKYIVSLFVNTHVIKYLYEEEDSPFCFALKLTFKHLGSLFAAAFVNSFFLIPSAIYDSFRNCGDSKFQKPNCCNTVFDLVRSDAIPFTILTGSSYCSSAKYCDYFWY